MWLRVPEAIEKMLWEGPMEPATEDAVERLARDQGVQGINEDIRDSIRNLPIVSIGQPEVWRLPEIYPQDKMPRPLQIKLAEADFYLVRLACSFRARQSECQVEWARFLVELLPDKDGRQPIAYDLHPYIITQEIKRNIKVNISPMLKFQEVEATLGELAFGIEYPQLQPIISAAGAGEAKPSWDYEEALGMKVTGVKWMHLLLKMPFGMEFAWASLDLVADVRVRKSILGTLVIRDKKKAGDSLIVLLVQK